MGNGTGGGGCTEMGFLSPADGHHIVVAVENVDSRSASLGWLPSPAQRMVFRRELLPHACGRAPVSRDCGLEGASDRLRPMRSQADNGRFFGTEATVRPDVAITRLLRSV